MVTFGQAIAVLPVFPMEIETLSSVSIAPKIELQLSFPYIFMSFICNSRKGVLSLF